MLRGVFVTGTDTGVGKTAVSAALILRYAASQRVRYWKPVQTGIEQDDDTARVQKLAGCRDAQVLAKGVRLPRPVSPDLAARLSAQPIDMSKLLDTIRAESPENRWVVEGAGGVLVPLTADQTLVDLMVRLSLPVVVVARSTLGTINHTLLTLEAVRARDLSVAGVVMVGPPDSENRAAIEQYGRVDVLGEMPLLSSLDTASLRAWASAHLDKAGRLSEYFE